MLIVEDLPSEEELTFSECLRSLSEEQKVEVYLLKSAFALSALVVSYSHLLLMFVSLFDGEIYILITRSR